ncbi:PREDICTED: agamous-like MADS-box protein AGL80 [Theobroma cacao]|uniref:Agamous-like MADS-box protein AGL80 n=1 Tax=Theobroma cacao TaxID=3641 RepID=A0AB32WAP1_THECC|nr:PREDICTED: agamous-like MADS-box protein AGL80 [Theobroma cacao]
MTKNTVKISYITKDSARKATFRKRKKGLLKKASELSTLCGIDASVIIYSPYNTQPEVWPSPTEAERVLSKFKKMPKMDQSMEMMSQESFLKRRIELANKQLKRQCRDNREEEITQVMFQCLAGQGFENLNMMDLNDLEWLLEQNMRDIDRRINMLTKASHSQGSVAAASATMATPEAMLKSGEKVHVESPEREVSPETEQRQQLIKDLMHSPENIGLDSVLSFGDNNPIAFFP